MQVPAPTFLQTRSILLMRENQLANAAPGGSVPSQVALYGNTAGSSTDGNSGSNSGNGSRWSKKKKNVGGGATNSNTGYPVVAPGPWICFNPYTSQAQQMQPAWRPYGAPAAPAGGAGLLGPAPRCTAPTSPHRRSTWVPPGQVAYMTQLAPLHGLAWGTNPPPPAAPYNPTGTVHAPAWDCCALVGALNAIVGPSSVGSSTPGTWVMDSGATSHMVFDPGILSTSSHPPPSLCVTVGNGVPLPITATGHVTLRTPSHTFYLNNVLVVPYIIKNLLSTCQFTIDNSVSVEYDPCDFSIKDLHTLCEIRQHQHHHLVVWTRRHHHHIGAMASSLRTSGS
nr:uncharacterized protein LOC109754771 [Aegilops tauschii subsp. strangulata]